MASGVKVNDACVEAYQDLKLKKSSRYVIFKVNADNTEIVVDKVAPTTATYAEFKHDLPDDDTRYAVYDFPFTLEGGLRNKILFVVWAPDTAKLKRKMIIAASKEAFRKKLVGIGAEIQATDRSEIEESSVLEKVAK